MKGEKKRDIGACEGDERLWGRGRSDAYLIFGHQ